MFDFAVSRAQGRDAACQKAALEIGQHGRQILRRRCLGEKWALSENLVHSAKIISIIRAKIEDTLGGQSLGGLNWETIVDQAVLMVAAFGPGVGKINVQGLR